MNSNVSCDRVQEQLGILPNLETGPANGSATRTLPAERNGHAAANAQNGPSDPETGAPAGGPDGHVNGSVDGGANGHADGRAGSVGPADGSGGRPGTGDGTGGMAGANGQVSANGQAESAAKPEIRRQLDDPHGLARRWIRQQFTHATDGLTIAYWDKGWHGWNGAHYAAMDDEAVRANISRFCEALFFAAHVAAVKEFDQKGGKKGDKGEPACKKVTERLVRDVEAAAKSVSGMIISSDAAPKGKAWRSGGKWPADEVIPMKNCLVHIRSLVEGLPGPAIVAPTPRFFCTYSLPYEFRPELGDPIVGRTWLESAFPDDAESIDSLQEFFGALLDHSRVYAKDWRILLVYGPTRSGKGLIDSLIDQLVGAENVAALTPETASGPFGLEECIGKLAVVVGDTKIDGSKYSDVFMERIKNITGGDRLAINRKNKRQVSLRLPLRGAVMTNRIPEFRDASSAVINRFLALRMVRSFLGAEDLTLAQRLADEMPRFFNWSIAGLRRVRERRGRFHQPESGKFILAEMDDASSPVKKFFNTYYKLDTKNKDDFIICKDLYNNWDSWRYENDQDVMRAQEFGKNLLAAFPEMIKGEKRIQVIIDGSAVTRKVDVYLGVTLKPEDDCEPDWGNYDPEND